MKLIAGNPKAKSEYFIEEVVEAGLVLTGTEVKSLRSHTPDIKDAYVHIRANAEGNFEAFLLHAHIPVYANGNIWNHAPLRDRKLLLQRRQIDKLYGQIIQKGKSLIPLKLYFKEGIAKIELGLGVGKKHHDKRQDIKNRTVQREMDQAMKRSGRNR